MPSESATFLWDACEAAKAIQAFTADVTKERFFGELILRSAIERQLEILGEALGRLRRTDEGTARSIPELSNIIGMRDIIVHEYGNVDYEIVWTVVTKYVPALVVRTERLLAAAQRS